MGETENIQEIKDDFFFPKERNKSGKGFRKYVVCTCVCRVRGCNLRRGSRTGHPGKITLKSKLEMNMCVVGLSVAEEQNQGEQLANAKAPRQGQACSARGAAGG